MGINYSKILPELYVGTVPSSIQDIDRLKQDCGITAVLNLQTDADIAWHKLDWPAIEQYYRACQIEICRAPIRDFDPDDLSLRLPEAAAALDAMIRAGHRVYIHCTAGVNRSPTAAIAYLYKYRGYDLETAARIVKECRICEPYLDAIRNCKFE